MALQEPVSFLDAAYEVLTVSGRSMTPTELVGVALRLGLLRTVGVTPEQTMKSKLSTEIRKKGDSSAFVRTGPNLFGLRCWGLPEFIAPRFEKGLMREDIVVFDRDILRDFFPSDGITRIAPEDGEMLSSQLFTMNRQEAEETFDVVQLVSQFLVMHSGKIATYKRSRRLPEERLHGQRSLLFGGHLNWDDLSFVSPFDPENGHFFIRRELAEEVIIKNGSPSLRLIGGIYDPRSAVSEQHVGVLYEVRLPVGATMEIGERGFLMDLSLQSVEEIQGAIDAYENWSELVHRTLLQTGEVAT